MVEKMNERSVVAYVSTSIDGCTGGPDGTAHDHWLYEHAGTTGSSMAHEPVWRRSDTAIVGRTNYEGFASVWPGIETDPATDPDTRALAHWLNTVEKVAFSRTITEPVWANSRIATDVGATVRELKAAPGRDILVLNSASIIQELLRLDLLDDLYVAIVPVMLGGGVRLLPDGLPASRWTLAGTVVMEHGAVALHWRRAR